MRQLGEMTFHPLNSRRTRVHQQHVVPLVEVILPMINAVAATLAAAAVGTMTKTMVSQNNVPQKLPATMVVTIGSTTMTTAVAEKVAMHRTCMIKYHLPTEAEEEEEGNAIAIREMEDVAEEVEAEVEAEVVIDLEEEDVLMAVVAVTEITEGTILEVVVEEAEEEEVMPEAAAVTGETVVAEETGERPSKMEK